MAKEPKEATKSTAAPAPSETVSLSVDVVRELMQAVARTNTEGLREVIDKIGTQNAESTWNLSKEKIDQLRGFHDKPGLCRTISCKSPYTGATFDAEVKPDRYHKHGRILRFTNYRFPVGILKNEREGGIVPDGMPVFNSGSVIGDIKDETAVQPSALNAAYKQWRYEQFNKTDTNLIIGLSTNRRDGAMKPEYCVDPEELLKEYDDGTLWKDRNLEAAE